MFASISEFLRWLEKKKNQFDLDLAIEAFFQYQNEDRCFYGFGKTPFIFVGSSVYAFP